MRCQGRSYVEAVHSASGARGILAPSIIPSVAPVVCLARHTLVVNDVLVLLAQLRKVLGAGYAVAGATTSNSPLPVSPISVPLYVAISVLLRAVLVATFAWKGAAHTRPVLDRTGGHTGKAAVGVLPPPSEPVTAL